MAKQNMSVVCHRENGLQLRLQEHNNLITTAVTTLSIILKQKKTLWISAWI
jgi:hypothetical protein